jgi:hypothetical protein
MQRFLRISNYLLDDEPCCRYQQYGGTHIHR